MVSAVAVVAGSLIGLSATPASSATRVGATSANSVVAPAGPSARAAGIEDCGKTRRTIYKGTYISMRLLDRFPEGPATGPGRDREYFARYTIEFGVLKPSDQKRTLVVKMAVRGKREYGKGAKQVYNESTAKRPPGKKRYLLHTDQTFASGTQITIAGESLWFGRVTQTHTLQGLTCFAA